MVVGFGGALGLVPRPLSEAALALHAVLVPFTMPSEAGAGLNL